MNALDPCCTHRVVDDDAACNVLVVLVKAHGVNEDGRLHQEVGTVHAWEPAVRRRAEQWREVPALGNGLEAVC